MKKIIIGDLHFDSQSDPVSNERDYNNKIKIFIEQIFPYMKKHNIKHIIQLGDFTDRRTKISTFIQHKLKVDIFDYLEDNGITLEYIVGNHDMFYKDKRDIYTLSIFEKAYDNFIVYNEPTLIDNILFVPWLLEEDKPKVHKLLDKAKLCIGHFELKDYNVSSTFKATHGLDENFFKSVDVISGHYHGKQGNNNILYAGVPYQQTWDDYGHENGFYVLDTNNLGIDNLEFIETTVCTKHIKVFLDSENKTINVFGLGKDINLTIDSKTDYSFTINNKLKIYIDKSNAFNKKIIEKLTKDCISYKIDVLEEVNTLVEVVKDSDYDVTKTISSNLETPYQKEVYDNILKLSLSDMD